MQVLFFWKRTMLSTLPTSSRSSSCRRISSSPLSGSASLHQQKTCILSTEGWFPTGEDLRSARLLVRSIQPGRQILWLSEGARVRVDGARDGDRRPENFRNGGSTIKREGNSHDEFKQAFIPARCRRCGPRRGDR